MSGKENTQPPTPQEIAAMLRGLHEKAVSANFCIECFKVWPCPSEQMARRVEAQAPHPDSVRLDWLAGRPWVLSDGWEWNQTYDRVPLRTAIDSARTPPEGTQ